MAAAYVEEVRRSDRRGRTCRGLLGRRRGRLRDGPPVLGGRPSVPFLALIEAAPDAYYAAPRTPLQLARFAANLPTWLGDLAALGPRAGLARARRSQGRRADLTGQRGPLSLDEVFDDVSALPASRVRSAEAFARALTRYRPGRQLALPCCCCSAELKFLWRLLIEMGTSFPSVTHKLSAARCGFSASSMRLFTA